MLPLGPAMLAVESGAPAYVPGVRRAGVGRYRGRLDRRGRPRRGQPARAGDRDHDRCLAAAFERIVEDAPSSGGRSSSRSGRTSEPRPAAIAATGTAASVTPSARDGADLHIHTVASDGTADIESILDHVARARRPGRHRDHRPRADRRRPGGAGDRAGSRPAASRSSSARRSPPSAATSSPCSSIGPIRPYRSLRATIAGGPRRGRAGDPGPSARALPAVRPGLGPAAPAGRRGSGRPPGRHRDVQPDGARTAVARSRRALRRAARPAQRGQQRRPRARGDRDRLDHLPGPDRGRSAARDRVADDHVGTVARSTARPASSATFGRATAQARPRRAGRGRRAGPPGRHRARSWLPGRARAAAPLRAAARR